MENLKSLLKKGDEVVCRDGSIWFVGYKTGGRFSLLETSSQKNCSCNYNDDLTDVDGQTGLDIMEVWREGKLFFKRDIEGGEQTKCENNINLARVKSITLIDNGEVVEGLEAVVFSVGENGEYKGSTVRVNGKMFDINCNDEDDVVKLVIENKEI